MKSRLIFVDLFPFERAFVLVYRRLSLPARHRRPTLRVRSTEHPRHSIFGSSGEMLLSLNYLDPRLLRVRNTSERSGVGWD